MTLFYVTPELRMPSGEKLSSQVVEISNGVVNKIYPFEKEIPGMRYLSLIYVSTIKGLENITGVSSAITVAGCTLYAYSVDGDGSLKPLL